MCTPQLCTLVSLQAAVPSGCPDKRGAGTSFIKPDLIVRTANQMWILDDSVDDTWDIKSAKYGRPDRITDIQCWADKPDTTPVHQLTIVISNRGLFY